ncbi:DUF1465 family protein [Erythrobacter sp. LQ02-29]|uniref:DUF1465 family protein n=1 Tax=Erythrobacter sp. LQ02-29 TaxID=2920384 RepID=UPI001F4E42DC|nr:DUF1465 family protein [Erythrobacter sp. LQ02-29]MCP9222231.1 DUF1465 family protein [Erythrobacter sp. LQ02-29]
MPAPSDINVAIVESLYSEALVLADEVRATFDLMPAPPGRESDPMRIALSTEGLKTTTRIMHLLAWLMNQRAYLSGRMGEVELRRAGRLPTNRPSEARHLRLLSPTTCELIAQTEQLHGRVSRIDGQWQRALQSRPEAVARLRERLYEALGSF